jgi:hypothetical protein
MSFLTIYLVGVLLAALLTALSVKLELNQGDDIVVDVATIFNILVINAISWLGVIYIVACLIKDFKIGDVELFTLRGKHK